ncbi:MAG: Spy/CpxP family protein refolding chaperone [Advenella sp.]|nr:Spy/CpxP family protein refolding chaperone [Advenella sp.]
MAKSISSFVVKSLTAATAALAIGSTFSVAVAQPQDAGSRQGMSQKMGDGYGQYHKGERGQFKHHGKQMRTQAAIVIPGFGPASQQLVDDLKLNDEQKAKLQAALENQKQARGEPREMFKKTFDLRKQQVESGKLDPKAMLEAQKQSRAAMQEKRDAHQAQWLALWDSFTPEQQTTVGKYYQDSAQKMQERKEQRAKRMEERKEKREQRMDNKGKQAPAEQAEAKS